MNFPSVSPMEELPQMAGLKMHACLSLPAHRQVSYPPPRSRESQALMGKAGAANTSVTNLFPGGLACHAKSLRFSSNLGHLLQAELGKPRRSSYTLPGPDFSYGLYIHRTDGGVPEAIGHWHTMKPRPALLRKMPHDYITMNCGALKAGYTTAHEFNLYYKAKDIHRKADEESRFKRGPPKVPADMTYGIVSRPSTPFFDLLHHKYKELWMEQQRATAVIQQEEKKKVITLQLSYETRTTLLRKHPLPAKEESFWHLPRLEKVWSAVQVWGYPLTLSTCPDYTLNT
uniref:Cilia and flagella associated protein 77 n=1 Tax=Apteryx owenii TaxID=8824 RepID=A0A8B9PK13_APTOW